MASFIARMLDYISDSDNAGPDGPGRELPGVPLSNHFPCDVDRANAHYANIQRLTTAGIVEGTGTNDAGEACFGPGNTITRAQMASLIEGAEAYTDNTRVALADQDFFVDDNGDTHEDEINVIGFYGISHGIGTNQAGEALYGPGLKVLRDQMASFLARTLDLQVEEGMIVPPGT